MAETGYILTVKNGEDGDEYFKLSGKSISGYKFIMNSPDDVETKADNIMAELHIKGHFEGDEDSIPKLIAEWCKTNTDTGEAFKYLQFDYVVGDLVKRRYVFPNAFVVDFVEDRHFDHDKQESRFSLFVKQDKDYLEDFYMDASVASEVDNPEDNEEE